MQAAGSQTSRRRTRRSMAGRLSLGALACRIKADMRVLQTLLKDGFVPVVSSIGMTKDGQLLNVNADTMAGHLAGGLRARRLVIAGSTAGVLDGDGKTVGLLDPAAISTLVNGGTATAGMIAKLRACEGALSGGVDDVVIVD